MSIFNLELNGQRRPIVIIALGSRDRAADAASILRHIKSNYFAAP